MPSSDSPSDSETPAGASSIGDPATIATRRRFLTLGASLAAGLSLGGTAQAQRPVGRPAPLPAGTGAGADPSAQWKDPLLRLVRRITMGLAPADVALAKRLGFNGYLEYQLRPATIDDAELENLIAARLPMTKMAPELLRTSDSGEVVAQLADAAWYRAAYSKAQLRERMIDFWTDHFTISINKVGFLKMVDDRDVIRPHALGKFPDLLRASSESGAMLYYLDQNTSRTPTPNQNYAREIMELHTMGVDGGYSQNDVAELSRILTGWSMTNTGAFRFIRSYHDRNAKTFLGRSFPAMPSSASDAQLKGEGDTAIQMLLEHPSTARYISWKMACWLLAYDPPAAVVDATAATFTRTGGDIPSMIRTILSSKHLMAAPAKYKRPFHFAISGLRALATDTTSVQNIRSVRTRADQMGMPLFRWEQPNGYPDRIDWWSGLVITRWSYAQALSVLNSATTARVDSSVFRVPDNADGVVSQIGARLFAGEMPTALRTSLLSYLKGGTYNDTRVRETLSLALSSQEFQWY